MSTAAPVKPRTKRDEQIENETSEQGRKPVFEARLGRIVAAVWENTSDEGTSWFSVSITRLYKEEGSRNWKRSPTFGRDDLPLVSKVSSQAHDWIYQQQMAS